jgi:hypothetical protein
MSVDVSGPIDLLVLEFPSDSDIRSVGDELLALVERGTIRLYDLMVVRKDQDGNVTELVVEDTSLAAFMGARSGLLGEDDLADAAALVPAGTTAALLVYENSWAVPFVAAAVDAGGRLVATSRLTAQEINDALDVVERQS